MKYIKWAIIAAVLALATGGIEHGHPHLYDGSVPHVHSNGTIHIH